MVRLAGQFFEFQKDHVVWKIVGSGNIQGAKIYSVVDVPYSQKDKVQSEFLAGTRACALTMASGEVRLATFHIRLPIDKASFISAIRRQRDSYQTSFDAGGPLSHLEEAEKRTAMVKRIGEQLEKFTKPDSSS